MFNGEYMLNHFSFSINSSKTSGPQSHDLHVRCSIAGGHLGGLRSPEDNALFRCLSPASEFDLGGYRGTTGMEKVRPPVPVSRLGLGGQLGWSYIHLTTFAVTSGAPQRSSVLMVGLHNPTT